MFTRPTISLLLVFVLSACGGEEEPEIPDVSGTYNLVAHQRDSDCLPEVADVEQIWGFMTEAASGIRVMTLDVTQEVGELQAVLGPSECEWSGVVDSAFSVTLNGDCSEQGVVERSAHMALSASPFANGWELLGSMSLEIDTTGPDEETPDGVSDCTVDAEIEGTGG